jgi:hypothetical protein
MVSAEVLKKNSNQLIRLQFITFPNKAIYEAIVIDAFLKDFEFKTKEFSLKSKSEISRIDAYDKQPSCISDFKKNSIGNLDLRKFCFCQSESQIVRLDLD